MALTTRKIIAEQISSNFRECTRIVTASLAATPPPGHTHVRNVFCGINASDINFTNGKYLPGVQPPFDTGFEALGRVIAIGEGVKNVKVLDILLVSHVLCVAHLCFAALCILFIHAYMHMCVLSYTRILSRIYVRKRCMCAKFSQTTVSLKPSFFVVLAPDVSASILTRVCP